MVTRPTQHFVDSDTFNLLINRISICYLWHDYCCLFVARILLLVTCGTNLIGQPAKDGGMVGAGMVGAGDHGCWGWWDGGFGGVERVEMAVCQTTFP